MISGSCLCGAVRYKAAVAQPVTACHCTQCRKTSGHYFAATEVPNNEIQIVKDEGLAWYRSSPKAQRGFCAKCGSSLFWKSDDGDTVSVAAGTIDGKTNLRIRAHIFVADKGDYYELIDGVPQKSIT